MKHILLIGSNGMLGTAVEQQADTARYTITSADKDTLDITDSTAVDAYVQQLQPDIIINCAAYNAVDDIETDDAAFAIGTTVNGESVGYLGAAAKANGCILVHVSTDYVFGNDQTEPIREDATPAPLSRYAETKLLGETRFLESGVDGYIVRISRLFGAPGRGEGSKQSFVHLMRSLVEDKGLTELKVVDDQTSSPSYAPDVAQFMFSLLDTEAPYGIYHGANSGACTWYEWAMETFRLLGHDHLTVHAVPHTEFPRPAAVPAYSVLANTKMPEQRSWQEALSKFLS